MQTKKLEDYIEGKKEPFTLGDLASATGAAVHELKDEVAELMKKYRCSLEATDQGELLYDFGKKLYRRTKVTLGERLAAFGAIAWKFFSTFYKVIISVIMVVYFVIFVVLLVALMMAAMAASEDDSVGGGIGELIGGIFRSIFIFGTHHPSTYNPVDPWGYDYRHYEPRETHWPKRKRQFKTEKEEKLTKKSFAASVYDFALGPPRVPIDPLHNKQELASFLRQNKGITCISEVQMLAGWSREEAGQFLTSAIVDFDGDSYITENGTLVAEFDSLIRGTDDSKTPIVEFWNEYVPEFELTGNLGGRNAGIIFMNSFNLAMSAGFLFGAFDDLLPVASSGGGWFLLAWFPFVFSVSFFLLPLLRWGWVRRKNVEQHVDNIRRRIMRTVFQEDQEMFSLEQLTAIANEKRKQEEILKPKKIKKVVDQMIIDLTGDLHFDDNEKPIYNFHMLDTEMKDIIVERSKRTGDRSAGNVVPVL